MNSKLALSCLVIGALLTPIASLAADPESDRTHPMTYVKDSAITAKIKAQLAGAKPSSLARISVDTDGKGQVFLSGTARSQAEADKAIAIARATEGVVSVSSTISVKPDD